MYLLHLVNQHLKATGMTRSRFGREAVGDPCLVSDLDNGRECGARTTARILAYIARGGEGAHG